MPVILNAEVLEGWFRATARNMGIDALLYEAGEALFNVAGYDEVDQVAENIDAYNELLDSTTDEMLSDEPPLL